MFVMVSAQQAYQMLGNESLWDVASQCHAILEQAGIPHAIVGGVAVCLHGYRRNTVDLNLLVRRDDSDSIRAALAADDFVWNAKTKEFRSSSGIAIQFVIAGDREGKGQEVRFPDPSDA